MSAVFRQASRAYTTRALPRASTSSCCRALPAYASRRAYADDAASKLDAEKVDSEPPVQPESELEKKVAKKEAEITDLTVRRPTARVLTSC